MIKTDYSNEGKENLSKSLLFHQDRPAEWLFRNVVEVLQPSKTMDVIKRKGNVAWSKGFEMEAGKLRLYMDKTTYLKQKFNEKKDDSKKLE